MSETSVTVLEAHSWPDLTPERRGVLRDWMRANRIPADLVPVQEAITIHEDGIHYTEVVLDENQKPIYRDGLVTCQEIIAPLQEPFPAEVPDTFSP